MKLLIVDDEEQIRMGIAESIPWMQMGFDQVLTAGDGLEALRICGTEQPEIILTDIAMQGMSGLELGRRAVEMYQPVKIILFSGYSEFEYARQAVQIQAVDYLLKPVNIEELISKVAETREQILRKQAEEEQHEQIGNLNRIRRVWDHLTGKRTLPIEELGDNLRKLTGLRLDGDIGLYACAADVPDVMKGERILLYVQVHLDEPLKQYGGAMLAPYEGKSVILFEMDGNGENRDLFLRDAFRSLCDACRNQFEDTVSFAYGGTDGIRSIKALWDHGVQRLQNRLYAGGGSFFTGAEDPAQERRTPHFDSIRLEHQLIKLDSGGVKQFLDGYYGTLKEEKIHTDNGVREVTTEIRRLLFRTMEKLNVPGDVLADLLRESEELPRYITLDQYCGWICVFCDQVITRVAEWTGETDEGWIVRAIGYMRLNYHRNIRLEDTARAAGLSPHYFSSRFREVTGVSYVDCFTRIRIDAACGLLRDTRLTVEDVASRTGFSDPKYFASVFRKEMGESPAKWRGR